jgi:gliding motility-associated-like protein
MKNAFKLFYAFALLTASIAPVFAQQTLPVSVTTNSYKDEAADTFNVFITCLPSPTAGVLKANGVNYFAPTMLRIPGNSILNINEAANPGFAFNSWHLVYHTPLPNDTAHTIQFTVVQNDTVYAIYDNAPIPPPDSFNLTINVSPPLSGKIKAAGNTSANYPFVVRNEENAYFDVEATGNLITTANKTYNYVFDHYALKHHTLLPDSNQSVAYFQFTQDDTLTAYFVDVPLAGDSSLYLLIPTGFSPNADGVNDRFNVVAEQFTEYNMQVYNRWGIKVFESDNQTYGWNGEYKTHKCELGVYTYVLRATRQNGETLERSGAVTLIR